MCARRLLAPSVALVVVVVAAVLVVVGSGDHDAAAKSASGSGVVAQFAKSGGFVGVDVRTTIRADRRVTVTQRGGAVKRHTIRAATLTALRATLDAARIDRPLGPTQTGCADCFAYAITYKGRKAAFDESAVPSRMRKALAELSRIAGGGR